MTYSKWQLENLNKRSKLQRKLESWGLNHKEVIDYFNYDNMVKNQPEYCGLYADNTKCHDMENLNCYLCACPHFVVHEPPASVNDTIVHSGCSVNSKFAAEFQTDKDIHCDCSNCTVPHTVSVALKHYEQLPAINDTCSLLELIRNWQLFDIFGKYKIF